jgi:hypothetical protein
MAVIHFLVLFIPCLLSSFFDIASVSSSFSLFLVFYLLESMVALGDSEDRNANNVSQGAGRG